MAVKTAQAIINGQTYTLTYNSTTKKYEATITAPSASSYNQNGHYYNVTVKATDVAGNQATADASHETLGSSLQLRVKEKVAPVITLSSPTSGSTLTNNKPTITWLVKDEDSGVNQSTIGITIDSGSKITSGITKTAVSGGYQCSYTPTSALSDGSHTIKLDASDNDGNAASTVTATIKVDTVPPVLTLSSPTDGLVTNNPTCTISGTTNDATSSPVTVKVNGKTVTVNGDGTFSTTVTLTEGSNTITVVSTDSAGKSSTVTRTVTLDTAAPVISDITMTPNPVDAGKTFVLSVTITD